MSDAVVCFDLDDTLYKEIDFVQSAFGEIAEIAGCLHAVPQMISWFQDGENVFEVLIESYDLDLTVEECLETYRNHFPIISLEPGIKGFLDDLKESSAKVGLITDGRSISQRNKIKALGLDGFFDIEIISEEFGSEKPELRNYQVVEERFPERSRFVYVGDNPKKDFLAPNQLGWHTYCLKDDGRNIHRQVFSLNKEFLPQYIVNSIKEIFENER